MEIRRWQCCIVINCVILPFLVAKPFSINEALAAESKLKNTIDRASPASSETTTRFSLNKALTSDPLQKLRKFKRGTFTTSRSPLIKSRNIFQIGSSKLKSLLSPLRKHKPQTKKREIYKHDKIDEKYIPLFKNLGLLFDNLLEPESRDSYETGKHKHKRYKLKGGDRGVVCSCALKSDSEPGETRSHKKTVISTETLASEKPTVTTAATTDPTLLNLSGLRSDQNVPAILPRDPSGSRRNHHGHGARSSTTFHRNAERNLAGNFRNRQHNPRIGENEADAEYDEEDTDSHPRDDASGADRRGRGGRPTDIQEDRTASNEIKWQKSKKGKVYGRLSFELPRKVQLKTRRNETESEEFVPKYVRGVRGSVSENKIGDVAESLQSEENTKEDIERVALPGADDQRVTGRGGEPSTDDQEIRPRNETMITLDDFRDINLAYYKNPNIKSPAVTIIDGYSVAKDKNGQNKLSEKTIRFHSS